MKYEFCGTPPLGFNYQPPKSENFVFIADPNFIPINLQNFFGSIVTVNSYYECFYYGELGWSVSTLTIFDIAIYTFAILLLTILFFLNYKKKFLFNNVYKQTKSLIRSKNSMRLITLLYIFFQIRIVYEYVKNKAISLKPFVDEYVSISSNYHFFRELNFSAGGFLGDTFSVYLTSGPISAIGSVFGWVMYENIYVSRIFNYFWIVILLFLFFIVVKDKFKLKQNYYLLFIFQLILLVPWWQGVLYSLGEIPSLLLVVMAMLTFQKNRKLSLILFGLSIFLGKFLNILIFLMFYICIFANEKSLKNLLRDAVTFIVALVPWFVLINFTYQKGNVVDYFYDLYYFVTDSSASGVQVGTLFNFSEITLSILSSEYAFWNVYEKIRIGILPLILLFLILKNKKSIDLIFGNVSLAIFSSITFLYLWFWVLNPLKWMRYSQHFTFLLILLILSLVLFEVFPNKTDYFISLITLAFYLDNTKNYFIYYLIIFCFLYIFLIKKPYKSVLIIFMSFLITFDISMSVLKKDFQTIPDINIRECKEDLNTDICRESYFNSLNE
jgi:hypothetical protein